MLLLVLSMAFAHSVIQESLCVKSGNTAFCGAPVAIDSRRYMYTTNGRPDWLHCKKHEECATVAQTFQDKHLYVECDPDFATPGDCYQLWNGDWVYRDEMLGSKILPSDEDQQ